MAYRREIDSDDSDEESVEKTQRPSPRYADLPLIYDRNTINATNVTNATNTRNTRNGRNADIETTNKSRRPRNATDETVRATALRYYAAARAAANKGDSKLYTSVIFSIIVAIFLYFVRPAFITTPPVGIFNLPEPSAVHIILISLAAGITIYSIQLLFPRFS